VQEQMLSTSVRYLEAARSALQWVSVPKQKNRDLATQQLEAARQGKSELEKNQWLISR